MMQNGLSLQVIRIEPIMDQTACITAKCASTLISVSDALRTRISFIIMVMNLR